MGELGGGSENGCDLIYHPIYSMTAEQLTIIICCGTQYSKPSKSQCQSCLLLVQQLSNRSTGNLGPAPSVYHQVVDGNAGRTDGRKGELGGRGKEREGRRRRRERW